MPIQVENGTHPLDHGLKQKVGERHFGIAISPKPEGTLRLCHRIVHILHNEN